nr:reverse transcriptase domain-containing protein [Tanacetum cinerariifolium]
MHADAKKDDKGMLRFPGLPPVPRNPQQNLTPIMSPWPFYKRGIDIARPFKGPGKVKILTVAIDYFTKWIEAKPVATIMGIPHYDQVKQRIHAILAYVQNESSHPTEIGMPTLRTAEIDMVQNDEALEINLDLSKERKEQEAICEVRSKEKMEKYYNSKVRNTSFKPEDIMYRNNDVSLAKDSEKLSPKWEGPYEVTKALRKRSTISETVMESSYRELGTCAT